MTTKRRTFTTAQKTEILVYADENTVKKAIEKYSITESQFYKWKGSSLDAVAPKKIAIESDDDYLIIKISKKAATKELLSALL